MVLTLVDNILVELFESCSLLQWDGWWYSNQKITQFLFLPKNIHPYGKSKVLSKQVSICFGLFSHFKSFPLLQSHTNICDAKFFTQQSYPSIAYDCRTGAEPGLSHVCQHHKQLNLLIPANSSSPELFPSPDRYFEMSGTIAGIAAVDSWNP